jgi:hypothetical protein
MPAAKKLYNYKGQALGGGVASETELILSRSNVNLIYN